MMPIYGFLEGDTMGLLVLADEEDTAAMLATKLASAAHVRVETSAVLRVFHQGRELDPSITVVGAGIEALDRIDVVRRALR